MRRTTTSNVAVAIFICAGLIAGCSSGGDNSAGTTGDVRTAPTDPALPTSAAPATDSSSTDSTTTVAPAVPDVPSPPSPATIAGSTPQERALSLARSVDTTGDPIAGWLAVYDALGVPVLGADGVGIGSTDDDPVGPPFSIVWMLSDTASSPSGLPLTDVVRMYVDDDQPSTELADALLADLRAAAASGDEQQALFANFVAERARRSGSRNDPLDPAVVAADVYIDGATAQLVSWVVLRSLTAVAAAGSTTIMGLRAEVVPTARSRQGDTPCAETWGDETTTYWVNWFANKIGSGLQLPGMTSATKGLVEMISELSPHILSPDTAAKAGTLAKRANMIGGLLSLIMQVSSLTVDASQDPDPFERNKRRSQGDGKSTIITWAVRMDIGSLPDGNQKALCAATFLLNTLGVSFSFPTDGALAGVDVTFQGNVGFANRLDETGAFVYQDMNELTQTTDAAGATTTKITARAQKRDFPDSAKQVIREFSLDVAAQVEAENLNSLLNVFFDGLAFGVAPDGYGIGAGAVDIAKTLHWDLGEHTFRMYDWQAGWKIDQESFGYHFTGIVCDTMEPFTIDAAGNLAGVSGIGTFTLTPTSESTATWAFLGAMAGGVFSYHAEGTGEIQTPENADVVVHLDASDWVADTPAGSGPMGQHLPAVDLVLVPLETEECSGG